MHIAVKYEHFFYKRRVCSISYIFLYNDMNPFSCLRNFYILHPRRRSMVRIYSFSRTTYEYYTIVVTFEIRSAVKGAVYCSNNNTPIVDSCNNNTLLNRCSNLCGRCTWVSRFIGSSIKFLFYLLLLLLVYTYSVSAIQCIIYIFKWKPVKKICYKYVVSNNNIINFRIHIRFFRENKLLKCV